MKAAQQLTPPAQLKLADLLFWQVAGMAIGGLTLPIAAAYAAPEGSVEQWFWFAVGASPLTAVVGGMIGTVIGIGRSL